MYLPVLDAFVQGWILGDFGPWMAYSGILPFMHSLTEGWGVKGAALYFPQTAGPAWSSSSMSRRGLSTYVLNIQLLSHLLKSSKGQDPPSHTEKQHRPIVTTVGFWIQYNKIALSLSPPTLPCFTLTSHSLGRNHKMVFLTFTYRKLPSTLPCQHSSWGENTALVP